MDIKINKIYCGDCLDIMRDMEDNSVDLVLTDPPYGMAYHSGRYVGENPHKPIVGDDKPFPTETIAECIRIAKNAVYAFCRWDNIGELPSKPKSLIVWHKNNWTAGDLEHAHGRMWESIAFYPQDGHKFTYRMPDVLTCPCVPPTELQHPAEKPVDLLMHLIETNIGDTIFDPFCGSGTTCVAAKRLGRNFIGIDISEEYCQIARDRLAAEQAGLTVKEMKKGQGSLFTTS